VRARQFGVPAGSAYFPVREATAITGCTSTRHHDEPPIPDTDLSLGSGQTSSGTPMPDWEADRALDRARIDREAPIRAAVSSRCHVQHPGAARVRSIKLAEMQVPSKERIYRDRIVMLPQPVGQPSILISLL